MKASLSLRLTLSSALVVLAVAVLLTSVSLTVFQTQFEAQLLALHRQTLAALAQRIDAETNGRLKLLYREIAVQLVGPSLTFLGPDDDPRVHSGKVTQTYQALVDWLNRHLDAVEEIQVEYVRTGLSLSTRSGLGWPPRPPTPGRSLLLQEDQSEAWQATPEALKGVRGFPLLLPPGSASAVVTVSFRPLWKPLLEEYASQSSSHILLLDPRGGVIFSSGTPPGPGDTLLENRVDLFGGLALVDRTVPGRLFQEAESIRLLLLLFSIVVLAGGIGLAAFLTYHHSRPWVALWRRAQPLVVDEGKAQFFQGNRGEGFSPPPFPLWVWWCRWSHPGGTDPTLLPYRLAEDLEARLGAQGVVRVWSGCLAVAAPYGPEEPSGQDWRSWAQSTWGCRVVVGVGPLCSGLAEMGPALEEARGRAEWARVFPEQLIFGEHSDLDRRRASKRGYSRKPLADLAQALRLAQEPAINAALASIRTEVREGAGNPQDLTPFLEEALRVVADWSGTPVEGSTTEVDSCLGPLRQTIQQELLGRDRKAVDRRRELVDRIHRLMAEHLAEDLSLDRMASEVHLSPGYLSSLYREVTGTTYVAAVTDARLEQAQHLLRTTRDPVVTIARAVGFQTPAYFIRQYKARFGRTPAQDRR